MREQKLFRDIVKLTFEEAGLPKQLQPDLRPRLFEQKQFRKVQEQIAKFRATIEGLPQ
jgi:hypothetical protein